MKLSSCCAVAISFLALVVSATAQTSPSSPEATSASVQVPRLIKFSGIAKDQTGKPLSGVLGITFALYQAEQGGAPLWLETQNAQADTNGHYTVMLGTDKPEGLPLDLFTSGEARWLGVKTQDQPEQPRVLLVSVPYAIKAHEAETLSGKTISDFVLLNNAKTLPAGTSNNQMSSNSAGSPGHPPTNGPTNFAGSNNTQIVGVTQSGSGTGLSATATTHPAVAGTITGPTSGGAAVQGLNNATSGVSQGVSGQTSSVTANSSGVNGFAAATTGQVYGVIGSTNSNTGNAAGVSGFEGAATGFVFGVSGVTNSTSQGAAAVNGFEGATAGQVFGVAGSTNSTSQGATGVNGYEGATTGRVFGVAGSTNSTTNFATGVSGYEGATTGQVFGVSGGTNSTSQGAAAVNGWEGATTGQVFGVNGGTKSTTQGAAAVNGYEGATTGQVFGVSGGTNSTTNYAAGVSGFEAATTGRVWGVNGGTNSTTQGAAAVNGYEGATTGQVYGVNGGTNSTTQGAAGVNGFEGATTGQVYGVNGSTNSTTNFASGVSGFEGATTGIVFGVQGGTNSMTNGAAGVSGSANATTGATTGVSGSTNSSTAGANGVFGGANATTGVTFGVQGMSNSSGGVGVQGSSPNNAIAGFNQTCNTTGCTLHAGIAGKFVTATGGTLLQGLSGSSLSSLAQVFSVDASGNGSFSGNLNVTGKLTKGSGSFKIDDPLDPAHKYLSHSFVESPDMKNVYDGNVTTDKHGLATVVLPDYFEALNRDFRYQLTVIGQFAQAIVQQEIQHNRFTIKTSKPSVKVSWQVTGIRHDAYADAYRIPVEEEKPPQEQGHYLHPELFGASEHEAIGAGMIVPSTGQLVPREHRP